jgi:hypothetical protein
MTTTHIYTPAELDTECDDAVDLITKSRARTRVAVLSLLGAALLGLLGMTYAMYSRAPVAPSSRTGMSR